MLGKGSVEVQSEDVGADLGLRGRQRGRRGEHRGRLGNNTLKILLLMLYSPDYLPLRPALESFSRPDDD